MVIAGVLHDYKKNKPKHGEKMAKHLKEFLKKNNIYNNEYLTKSDIEILEDTIRYHSNNPRDFKAVKKSKNKKYIKILQKADILSKHNIFLKEKFFLDNQYIKLTNKEIDEIVQENIKKCLKEI